MGGKGEPYQLKIHKTPQQEAHINSGDTTQSQFRKKHQNIQNREKFSKGRIAQVAISDKIQQSKENNEERHLPPALLLRIVICLFFVQMAIESTLMVLQYISDKLSLNIFCALICLSMFFHLLVLHSLPKLRDINFSLLQWKNSSSSILPQPTSSPLTNLASTQQKINRIPLETQNKKTLKVKHSSFTSPTPENQVTVKKINGTKSTTNYTPSEHKISEKDDLRMFLGLKIIDSLYQAVMTILCLVIPENPATSGFTVVGGVCLLSVLLIIISNYCSIRLFGVEIRKEEVVKIPEKRKLIFWFRQQIIAQDDIENYMDEVKPTTVVSIEQHIKDLQLQSQKQVASIQNNSVCYKDQYLSKKDPQSLDSPVSPSNGQQYISPTIAKQLDDIIKEKQTKSVLKGSKIKKSNFQPSKLDNFKQSTRKVQMNIKKNQYYEYDCSSSVHSGDGGDNRRKNGRMKSKYAPHRQIHDTSLVVGKKEKKSERQKSKSESRSHVKKQFQQESPYFS